MEQKKQKNTKQHQKKQKQNQKLHPQIKEKQNQFRKQEQKVESSSESQNADIDYNHLDEQPVENIQANFLIAEVNQKYYHSLKTILLRFSQIIKINNSELADAVVQNKKIGNVVLADDEDDDQDQDQQQSEEDQQENEEEDDDELNVYSILTIFSGKKKLSKKIRSFIAKASEKKKLGQQIIKIINSDNTVILLNERLANLPAFIVNSAHQVFKKDLLELKKTDKKAYDELANGYMLNVSEIQFEGQQDLQKLIYSKFQDFEMCKRAKCWWLGQKNQTFKKKTDMRNLYYVIKTEEYLKGIDQIKTYLED